MVSKGVDPRLREGDERGIVRSLYVIPPKERHPPEYVSSIRGVLLKGLLGGSEGPCSLLTTDR